MKPIVTLTMNSSVDIMWEVDKVVTTEKLRASPGRADPGGGGLNASRVIKALDGTTIAVMTAGWFTGHFLRELVDAHSLLTRIIPIGGPTRASATIFDRSSGEEIRVTPPGPELSEAEWSACLNALFEFDTDYIIATGSLPRGVPVDFYRRLASKAQARGIRVVLDTSGPALLEALRAGVYLVKPNLGELEQLVGREIPTQADQEEACRQILEDGGAEIVALTLGSRGALLVWKSGSKYLACPKVEVKSAVGAGDSFTAALTLGLAQGRPLEEAFALGLATGSAAVMTPGTELCHREDVERLYRAITGQDLAPLAGQAAIEVQ
jgi:6-phosphofructokinase 2